MKNLYIPKGKTLHYETLYCQNIVNDGTLIVDGTLHARSISGKGILKAGTVSVRHVAEMDIECATMNGETMAAERVCAAEIVLSGSATVSCYLEAEYVEVPKLTMAKHNIGMLKDLSRSTPLEQFLRGEAISTVTFQTIFKQIYGRSPYAYLKHYRMNSAAVQLRESNESINQIALSLGYSNASKFARAFRDVFGVLPKDYRTAQKAI